MSWDSNNHLNRKESVCGSDAMSDADMSCIHFQLLTINQRRTMDPSRDLIEAMADNSPATDVVVMLF
jgi:hypothetical protein